MSRAAKVKAERDWRVRVSISFTPGIFAVLEKGAKPRERSERLCKTLSDVLTKSALPFRRSAGAWALHDRATATAKPRENGQTTATMSISFPPDLYRAIEAHRGKLGVDRSRYVVACLEHCYGIRPHPELFEASMRP